MEIIKVLKLYIREKQPTSGCISPKPAITLANVVTYATLTFDILNPFISIIEKSSILKKIVVYGLVKKKEESNRL